MTEPIKLTKEL